MTVGFGGRQSGKSKFYQAEMDKMQAAFLRALRA
jgi:hypothetical protein